MRRRFLVAVLTSTGLLAGCGDRQSSDAAAHREVHGEFTVGDATLRYTATFQDTALIAVSEEQSYGDLGQAHASYEVVDGRLVYYRCDEQRRVMNAATDRGYESVRLELEFDLHGRVQQQSKTVDGQPAELLGYEAPGVQRHFEELKRRADLAQASSVGGM